MIWHLDILKSPLTDELSVTPHFHCLADDIRLSDGCTLFRNCVLDVISRFFSSSAMVRIKIPFLVPYPH